MADDATQGETYAGAGVSIDAGARKARIMFPRVASTANLSTTYPRAHRSSAPDDALAPSLETAEGARLA